MGDSLVGIPRYLASDTFKASRLQIFGVWTLDSRALAFRARLSAVPMLTCIVLLYCAVVLQSGIYNPLYYITLLPFTADVYKVFFPGFIAQGSCWYIFGWKQRASVLPGENDAYFWRGYFTGWKKRAAFSLGEKDDAVLSPANFSPGEIFAAIISLGEMFVFCGKHFTGWNVPSELGI